MYRCKLLLILKRKINLYQVITFINSCFLSLHFNGVDIISHVNLVFLNPIDLGSQRDVVDGLMVTAVYTNGNYLL